MKKTTKFYIFALFSVALMLPLVFDLFYFNKLGNNFLLESSVFGFNYGKFFSDFIYNKSVFLMGNNNITTISHYFLFSFLYLLQFFFTPINSFFVFLITLLVLSYYFFVKLFSELIPSNYEKNNIFIFLLICILGLIFFTSISNFLFLSSTISFLLPTLSMVMQLYCIKRYIIDNEKKWLLFFTILNFLNTFNIANFLINLFFINAFICILLNFKNKTIISKEYLKKILFVNILYIPFLIIFFLQIFIGPMYIGSFGDVASSIREDFYSFSATFLNTFTQTNYWGLFGSFNGKLYNDFSIFYKNNIVYIFAFIPYILISFFIIWRNKKDYNKTFNKIIIYLLLLFLFLFQFMLGLNNIVYKFLYEKITIFQIFRNVTKISPLLLFLTLLILFLLIINRKIKSNTKKYLILGLLSLSLIFNIPYWTYSSYFFETRSITKIPQSYYDTADFLNKNLSYSDRVLLLPATYSLEYYNWGNNKIAVQGNIFDVLLNNGIKSYRLSQGFNGAIFFQKDSSKLFTKNDKSIRQLDVDYYLFSNFIKKYNLDYIVITKDLVSEYQDMDTLLLWLNNNGYKKINSFGNNDIYFNGDIFKPAVLFDDKISFERKNANNYHLYLRNIKKDTVNNLISFESFNKYWNLYLEPITKNNNCSGVKLECYYDQKIIEKEELLYLYKKPIFDGTHQIVNDYANQWTIDPNYIKQNFSKDYYKENPDGSIDIELTLYFKPQSYFYLGLIISGTTLLGCLGYLGWGVVKRRKRKGIV